VRIAVAADHAGFPLKADIVRQIEQLGHVAVDLGTQNTDPVDYPDVARAIGAALGSGDVERGILLCGSGIGASIAANKMYGVRAGICHDTYSARQGVEHDDMNVLTLGARVIGPAVVPDLVHAFVNAVFSAEERHVRRLGKVLQLEAEAAAQHRA
jgi:ribose 5-phosphate isomerase B